MSEVRIRPARLDDAGAIAAIYNHYIRTSTATFDVDEKTESERRDWLASRGPMHPVIVAVDPQGVVVGWGALSPWATRPAWNRTVEVAVYVTDRQRGKGVGPQVLEELVRQGRAHGHHSLISQIVGENQASISMTEKAGFSRVGTLHEVGYKFDRWLDVVLMELVLEGEV